jgi:hypothetical protein
VQIKDEWDLLIAEFGMDSEPMPLPLSKRDLKTRLMNRTAKSLEDVRANCLSKIPHRNHTDEF